MKLRLTRVSSMLPFWFMFASMAFGQGGRGPQLVSLKQVPVPQPTNIAAYVKVGTTRAAGVPEEQFAVHTVPSGRGVYGCFFHEFR